MLSQLTNLAFYLGKYPIIGDEGWEVGYLSCGSIQFLRKVEFAYRGKPCAYLVGIFVGNGWWQYCYNSFLWSGQLGGDNLDIPLDTPHEEVYKLAREKAIQQIDAEIERIDEEIAQHKKWEAEHFNPDGSEIE